MSFAPGLFDQSEVTPQSIVQYLALPRSEYGQALYDWYKVSSKLKSDPVVLSERTVLSLLERGAQETSIISRHLVGTSTNRKVYGLLDDMRERGLIAYHSAGHRKIWSISRIRSIVVPTDHTPSTRHPL